MKTNTLITVFCVENQTVTGKFTVNAMWQENQAVGFSKPAVYNTYDVSVYIPMSEIDDIYPKKGDMLIKGICSEAVPNSDEQVQGEWFVNLKANYKLYTIAECSAKDYGSNGVNHIELRLK